MEGIPQDGVGIGLSRMTLFGPPLQLQIRSTGEQGDASQKKQRPQKKQRQVPATMAPKTKGGILVPRPRFKMSNRRATTDSTAAASMTSGVTEPYEGEELAFAVSEKNLMSTSDVAKLVADEYFSKGQEPTTPKEDSGVDDIGGGAARLADENPPNLCSVPSLVDEETETEGMAPVEASSAEDALAIEVGHSAHEYLEECFLYTEVSVLDRDKFIAVPEIVKMDFEVVGHLGKGSFSDVFEVICRGGRLSLTLNAARTANEMAEDGVVGRRRPSRHERSASATISRPANAEGRPTYALKCLRPQIRSDADQFTIGAEDLVHETAILATLDHPNVIKLHGRASGGLEDAFVLNDGYFILLDMLKETLADRINKWKRDPEFRFKGPTPQQIEVAADVARAMSYLHSKNIVFRDLKPANVGFDAKGVLKLFDFGFAAGLPLVDDDNPEGLLYGQCGTPRYMAPEAGLDRGHGLPADVYSFGIFFWEVCSLCKPFAHICDPDEFDRRVFLGGERPRVDGRWPRAVGRVMGRCWSSRQERRPPMPKVKSALLSMTGDTDSRRRRVSARAVSVIRQSWVT